MKKQSPKSCAHFNPTRYSRPLRWCEFLNKPIAECDCRACGYYERMKGASVAISTKAARKVGKK